MYEKGNYYEAVMRSVEKLRKNPNNKNSREVLASAYPSAVNSFMDQIDNNKNANVPMQYTKEARIYQQLNGMYEHIQRSPGAMQVIQNPRKYYKALDRVKPLAAEEQYVVGMGLLQQGNRESAKQAYFHFLEADKFVPGYKDVGYRAEEAYNNAILHVVANLRPVQSRYYELSGEEFYRQVNMTLSRIEQNEFIRFYSPEEAKRMNLETPDQVIDINFEDFVVGETHTKEIIEKMERDSVKVGEIDLAGGRRKDVLGTVKADVVINHMEIVSRGVVSLTIKERERNSNDLLYQDFPGQFVWFHEWGHFNGDDRALTPEQIEVCNRRRIEPIPPQQMFVEFTKPIQQQLNNRLLSFYRNY
jgi:tetratricopeptide (TPR) repeat protein